MNRLVVCVMLVLVPAVVLAQDGGIPADMALWFGSKATLMLVIAGVVAWLRKYLSFVDGPVLVAAFTVVVGLLLGLAGWLMGYTGDATWVEALKTGAEAAVMAIVSMTVLDRVATKAAGG